MKSKFLLLFLVLFSGTALAQTIHAPQTINVQAVLVDDGGNVIINKQEADMTFSIIDGAGEVLYTEAQHVILVHGAISILVGQGNDLDTGQPTGGIPYDVFSPDGDRLLRMKLDDQSIPQEDLQIVSVPYSMYAQLALGLVNPLDSSGILNETIKQEDLSPELIAFIESMSVASASAPLTASAISVQNNFVNAAGRNVQSVFQGFDLTIGILKNQDDLLQTDIDARVLRAGDTMTGDLNMNNHNITNINRVDGVDLTDLNSRVGNLENGTTLDPRYVNVTGDTMTGILTMQNNIEMANGKLVDGVDVSADLVRKAGDTMTGDLSMNDAACLAATGHNCYVDTVDISALNTAVNALNFTGWDTVAADDLTRATVFDGDVQGGYDTAQGKVILTLTTPSQPTSAEKTAFAYGHCAHGEYTAGGSSSVAHGVLTGGYNVQYVHPSGSTPTLDPDCFSGSVHFQTSPATVNYFVTVTPTESGSCSISNKATDNFSVSCIDFSGGFGSDFLAYDFIVFYNP